MSGPASTLTDVSEGSIDWDAELARLLAQTPPAAATADQLASVSCQDLAPPWLALIPRTVHGPTVPGDRVRFAPHLIIGDQTVLAWHMDLRVLTDYGGDRIEVITDDTYWCHPNPGPAQAIAVEASRIWVEQRVSWTGSVEQALAVLATADTSLIRRTNPDPLHPVPVPPIPARLAGPLTGRRAIVTSTTEVHTDLRIVAEPHEDPDQGLVVVLMPERDWRRLLHPDAEAALLVADITHVWIEA